MNAPQIDCQLDDSTNGSAIDWSDALCVHHRWMRTVVCSRIDGAHEVDDVMQEVALAVLRQNCRPTDASKVAPWLYRVAVRQTVNYLRRCGRQRKLLHDFAATGGLADGSDNNPRDWVLGEEVRQCVSDALRKLPPRNREILLLKYTEDWTYDQLAMRLGVTPKTIEYRLMKARKALRHQLREFAREEFKNA